MATHFTLVKYITDSTISQALKNSRDGINYAREYPALIQNILIQGFLVICFPFLSSFIYVGCVSLLFNPFFFNVPKHKKLAWKRITVKHINKLLIKEGANTSK